MARIFTVLLIEDDERITFAMIEALKDAGHVVTAAATCEQARCALDDQRSREFDVVLLDLRLGADNGEDIFLDLMRRAVVFPPVIIVSAQPPLESQRAARNIRAARVIAKPASIRDICAAMEQAVA